MGFYQHYVLPPLLHLVMQQEAMLPFRRRVIGAAEGRVLEIGIGSGLNLPLYGLTVRVGYRAGPVTRAAAYGARPGRGRAGPDRTARSVRRSDAAGHSQHRHGGDDLDTLHDPQCAARLAEMRRVLRPGGVLLFVEHGRAPEPGVARWQDRLDPLWSTRRRRLSSQPQNRRSDLRQRFSDRRAENARLPGPRTHTFLYEGQAGQHDRYVPEKAREFGVCRSSYWASYTKSTPSRATLGATI